MPTSDTSTYMHKRIKRRFDTLHTGLNMQREKRGLRRIGTQDLWDRLLDAAENKTIMKGLLK